MNISKLFLFFIFILLMNKLIAQDSEVISQMVKEGAMLQDKGSYDSAIVLYDKALAIDKDNLMAMTEKAYTLLTIKKYNESIGYCKKVLEKNPADKKYSSVYNCYGHALSGLKQTDKAIEIYTAGINKYPDNNKLYFDRGVAYYELNSDEEAIADFQKSIKIRPDHASAHNALGIVLKLNDKRIPALLALCRFLVLEPMSQRAMQSLNDVHLLLKGDAVKRDDNAIAITMKPEGKKNSVLSINKKKENNFRSTEVMLTMLSAMDITENKHKSPTELLADKFEKLITYLSQNKKDNSGFYWNYYVPYFSEMKEKKFIQTFAYIISASSDDPTIQNWLDIHKNEVNDFYNWSDNYNW